MSNPGQPPQALPTADDVFGKQLPTANDAFGPEDNSPLSGPLSDQFFAGPAGADARILKSFGQGAVQGWGSEPLGFSEESEAALRKAGVFNDYQKGSVNLIKSFNEALMRPLAAGIAAIPRGLGALAGGLESAAVQTGQEVGAPGAGKGAAELIDYAAQTGVPELLGAHAETPEAKVNPVQTIDTARAHGVVGEGETGFFGTEPVSTQNLEARQDAAKEAGLPEMPPPQQYTPDIHELARQVDPDTINEWDRLRDTQDNLRLSVNYLEGKRQDAGYKAPIEDEISDTRARIQEIDEKIRDLLPKRAEAEARTQEYLEGQGDFSDKFRDMIQAQLLENAIKLQDMAPDVKTAYGHSADLLEQGREAREEASKGSDTQEGETGSSEPPEGTTRLYHGYYEGSEPQAGGSRWFTRDKNYAKDYGDGGRQVAYVDVPNEHPDLVKSGFHGDDFNGVAPNSNVLLSEKLAKKAKPVANTLPRDKPSPPSFDPSEVGAKASAKASKGQPLRETQGTGETKTRGLAQNIKADAIQQGLKDTFGDLPEYKVVKDAHQAERISEIMNSDPEMAKDIALGLRDAPEDVIPEYVFTAVKQQAMAAGDSETLRELANSPLVKQATEMGRRLRALGQDGLDTDPVKIIQKLQDARRNKAGGLKADAQVQSTINNIKEHIQKAVQEFKPDWDSFIKHLECQ